MEGDGHAICCAAALAVEASRRRREASQRIRDESAALVTEICRKLGWKVPADDAAGATTNARDVASH